MIKYIKLHNFLSLNNVKFDFASKDRAKKLVLLYGENGCGKTNFVKSISFLRESLYSLVTQRKMAFDMADRFEGYDSSNQLGKAMRLLKYKSISDEMRETCTIGSAEETCIEIGFTTKERGNGYYIIRYKDEQFTYEKLYYKKKGIKSGVVYEIHSAKDLKIKDIAKVCLFEDGQEALLEKIYEYWGKHTLLSIVNNDKEEQKYDYVDGTYTRLVLDVIEEIMAYEIIASSNASDDILAGTVNILDSLNMGIISQSDERHLDNCEKRLRIYLTESFSDIMDVHYDRKYKNGYIQYTLYIDKMINGERKTISIEHESNSIKHFAEIMESLAYASIGGIVVYDEVGSGIHDHLLSSVIKSLTENMLGQLIMTTHNTQLIEYALPENCYVIRTGYGGVKQVNCFTDFGIKPHDNVKDMYLRGLFGGIPETSLDFSDMYDVYIIQHR